MPDTQFYLSIQGRNIPLTYNTQLTQNDIPELQPQGYDGVVAQISPNPKNPAILGLKNCSTQAWIATLPNGEQKEITPNRSVKLENGTTMNFGAVIGTIQLEVFPSNLSPSNLDEPFSSNYSSSHDMRENDLDVEKMDASSFIVQKFVLPLAGVIILLIFWQLSTPKSGLPSVLQVLQQTWKPLIIYPFFDRGGYEKGLGLQILSSLTRAISGVLLATIIGILSGILVGSNKWLTAIFNPCFQALGTVPPILWLPLALASIRESQSSIFWVSFITAFFPIITNTAMGIQKSYQDYRSFYEEWNGTSIQYLVNIITPASLPSIFAGLRISIVLSWMGVIAAEMLVGGGGIGFWIWDAFNNSRISEIVLALFYVAVTGFFLEQSISLMETMVIRRFIKRKHKFTQL